MFAVTLAAFGAYTVGIPAALFGWLKKNQKQLQTNYFRERFGGLYAHFKDELYWWSSISYIRKFLIIFRFLSPTPFVQAPAPSGETRPKSPSCLDEKD